MIIKMHRKKERRIELNYDGKDSTSTLVREVVSEAVRLCSEYNWHDETSMRFALENTKNFLIENFNLEKNNARR